MRDTIPYTTGRCRVCRQPVVVDMPLEAVVDWAADTPLEEAWPEATPAQLRAAEETICEHHPIERKD